MNSALSGAARRDALIMVAVGNLMVALAMSPASTTLPTVAKEFGAELGSVSWVQTAYLMMLTGFMLVSGRLGDQLGHRQVYLLGIAAYSVAGVLSGLSQSVVQLILSRGLQGVGGAMMLGNGLAILTTAYPDRKRGTAIGAAMMASSAGSILGLLYTAVVLQYFSWRWVYFLLLPLGALAFLNALKVSGKPLTLRPKVDFLGGALLFLALTTWSLSLSHLHGGESSFTAGLPYHATTQALAVAFFLLFIFIESRSPYPLMVFRYFRYARFSFPLIGHMILHMVMMGTIFLVPFVIEDGLLLVPFYTVAFLVAKQAFTVAASPVSGWLYDRTKSRLLAPAAMAVIAVCLTILGLRAGDLSFGFLLVIGLPLGAAVGTFMPPNNTAIMESLPGELKGFASGMLETARQMGHGTAVAISSAVMATAIPEGAVRLGMGAAYLEGFQRAVLVMATISFLGVAASSVPVVMDKMRPALFREPSGAPLRGVMAEARKDVA